MNKEFRCWDPVGRKLYFGQQLYNEANFVWEDDPDGTLHANLVMDSNGTRRQLEISQYTGLKDIDGKKIFEGDILNNMDDDVKFRVVYSDKHACFYAKQLYKGRPDDLDDFEEFDFLEYNNSFPLSLGVISQITSIVGNIFEHPWMRQAPPTEERAIKQMEASAKFRKQLDGRN